jgi:pre-mRNA-splicing factor CWC26
MSLADYLAKKYLTADPPSGASKKSKKRKRKDLSSSTSGLTIADDDLTGFASNQDGDNDDGPNEGGGMGGPLMLASARSAEFRKAKTSGWKTVGTAAPSSAEQVEADAILERAAAERAAEDAANEAEDAPLVVAEDGDEAEEAGRMTGLRSGAEVARAMEKKAAKERKAFESMDKEMSGMGQETIYRDASGRIVNVAMRRAEARKKAEEEARKKREEEERAKGDVQRAMKEEGKRKLEDAKLMTVARYADDEELNDELKAVSRWNDPARGFVKEKRGGKSITGKPLYKGAAPPNRYGIRPGYRWDGVDRSNGFEKEYFAAQNRRKNEKELQYAWQMDE